MVLDGLTISLNGASAKAIGLAGCHGINLNGFGDEYAHDALFRSTGKTHVPGFGMTPGLTNMLAMRAAAQLDTVAVVRVSHGAFRPIAFSASITETTTYEYDPGLPGRVVYEDGELRQVPPFARPRDIALPAPYGTHPQYIIPHSETKTLARALETQGVRLIEVRGTWPPENMLLVRALYEWGLLRNEPFHYGGRQLRIMDVIGAYLRQSEEGRTTGLYGYALHVEVEGVRSGVKRRHTLTHTHPPSDGSVEDWAGLRAYTRNVGIPMAVGAQLIAAGRSGGPGVVTPEEAFRPDDVIGELEMRGIRVHEDIEEIRAYDLGELGP
jgi:saccharopine dehydrogenase-like NADP-dependent oxidoreductase